MNIDGVCSFYTQVRCRQCLVDLRSLNAEMHSSLVENAVAVLVNLSDWDFLLTLAPPDPRFPVLHLAQATVALATYIKGSSITLDIKKNCQALVEAIKPIMVVSSTSSAKRSKESMGLREDLIAKANLIRFFSKVWHPFFLQILATLLAALHNEACEDSAYRIHHDFTPLPFASSSPPTSAAASELLAGLRLVADAADRAPPGSGGSGRMDAAWLRLRGEIQFAVGNSAAALRFYLQSMLVATNYFQKSGGGFGGDGRFDEKLVMKVVRCLLDLGYHSYAVSASQLSPTDVDYSVCFKNLEERTSNDAMDGLYGSLWDVTVLEYAVSMHSKRGEATRKKQALGYIGALEVNTNNNVEILRETANFKRFCLLRTMCLNFL